MMLRAALLCGVTTLLFSSCFLLPKEDEILAPPLMEPPEIQYNLIEAKRATIENKIVASGHFIFAENHSLHFKHRGGRLLDVYVTYNQQVRTGDLLAELDTDDLQMQIRRQELAVRKTEVNLERVRTLGGDKYQRTIAELDVQLARLQLDALQNELAKARLFSPIDGIVTYIASLQEGDAVSAYRTVVQVAEPDELLLAYDGMNRSDFRNGMQVSIRIGDEDYTGTVVRTPLEAPPDVSEQMREMVLVDVENLPPDVGPGAYGTITLVLERSNDTIVIPRNLVHHYMGRKFVYVMSDGLREERSIETGIQTAAEVEVLAGLEEGETLVVN
jgi:RND family efflux transporter MFP subunit